MILVKPQVHPSSSCPKECIKIRSAWSAHEDLYPSTGEQSVELLN